MKFTGEFVTATFDSDKYLDTLKIYLKSKLHDAAGAWLEAVTGKVPVWSGMSQGALLDLVELINGTLVITPREGVQSQIVTGQSLGSAKPNYNLNDFKITITTNVPHYNTQEYTNIGVSKSAPWNSLIAGLEAARPILQDITMPKLILNKRRHKI